MHRRTEAMAELKAAIVSYATDRVRMDPPPLDGPRTLAELRAAAGATITPEGIGGLEALRIFKDVLAPACISVDHPRFLSFVPAAPTEAAILFDLVVGASSIYGGSWLEGGGAVFAENEALRWIADLAGMPAEAGGVFVSGGTGGNLSALVAARWRWRSQASGTHDRTRGLLLTSSGAHSSVVQAARAMDADVATVPADDGGRLSHDALQATIHALDPAERGRLFAIVATSGTTNAGVIDDLQAAAGAAAELGIWFHVDGAYGGAALAAPSVRRRFDGIEAADSFIVDPHKWLFAPFDSCALLYREPEVARRAHTQHAEYLDILHSPTDEYEWNASDYAHHLTRRCSRPAAVVQPGDARHAGVHRRHRDHAACHAGGRRARSRSTAPGTDPRTRALRRGLPPSRLGSRRLQGMERSPAGHAAVLRHADGLADRDRAALVHRQSADDGRRPRRHRRQPRR